MTQELQDKLYADYPKIFVEKDLPMSQTCMCWGIDCRDGWYNILNKLCSSIQNYIDSCQENYDWINNYNAIIIATQSGDFTLFDEYHKKFTEEYRQRCRTEIINEKLRDVPILVSQVIALQVKEKFGTLRFYYKGGNDFTSGLISMAESMSSVTCETCGNPGTRDEEGWIRTLCEPCRELREKKV